MSGYQRSEASKDQREIVGVFVGNAINRLEENWKIEFTPKDMRINLVHRLDGRIKSFLRYVDSLHSLVSVADVERAERKGKETGR